MRKMIFMLGALTLSGTAFAKKGAKGVADKKSGVRVKLTQNLYDIQNDWQVVDGDESDKTKTNSFNLLLGGGGRTEVTYLLGNGLELGVIGGVMQASQQFDGETSARATPTTRASPPRTTSRLARWASSSSSPWSASAAPPTRRTAVTSP